jgi:dihydrofolate reductase
MPLKASVFIATSLDGFIARSDGGLDWLPEGGGEPHGYTEFMATVDALVIGRKTFETVLSFPEWPYGTKPVIVLSSRPATLEAPPGAMCTFMAATPAEVIDRLAARGMGHLYIDGGVTIQRFLAAGLIQRLIITRVPVVLGTGIPLFGPVAHDLRFAHVATRAYPSGLVQSEYVVAA